MNKISLIKRTLGNRLNMYGFKYYTSEPNAWIFSRNYQDVDQFIRVLESNFSKSIKLEMFTSIDPLRIMEIREFYPKCKDRYYWDYTDEDSFIQILKDFTQLIIDYGLNALEELSVPTRESLIKVELDMNIELFENHESLCRRYIENYNVSIENTKHGILQIIQLMKEKQDVKYELMQELLLEMTAYYGNSIISKFNGEWRWNKNSNICIIALKRGNRMEEYLPLHDIVFSWRDISETENYLLDTYEELCIERGILD